MTKDEVLKSLNQCLWFFEDYSSLYACSDSRDCKEFLTQYIKSLTESDLEDMAKFHSETEVGSSWVKYNDQEQS